MIDYPTALATVLAQSFDWGTETITLTRSVGRVLAEPLLADRDQPPFDRVAMDGIAIQYAAYAGGLRHFRLAGIVAAGTAPLTLEDPTDCLEVMTGAVLPPGTDTVVRYEDLTAAGDGFGLPERVAALGNIHRRGADAAAGQTLLEPGHPITPTAINLLATCGYATVRVYARPRLTVVATGDELVGVDQQPAAHQIRRSNVHQLVALLAPWSRGPQSADHPPAWAHLPDDRSILLDTVADLLQQNEVVVFSGGVSKGKFDFLPGVLAELGVEVLFHRVAQRPGKPLWVGRKGGVMVFGLPGNPVSGTVGATAYVRPFLQQNQHCRPETQRRQLAEVLDFDKPLTLFQLARIDRLTQRAWPVVNAGSGDGASLLRADGLLVLPVARPGAAAGAWLEYLPF